jgi:hypothetical protein
VRPYLAKPAAGADNPVEIGVGYDTGDLAVLFGGDRR